MAFPFTQNWQYLILPSSIRQANLWLAIVLWNFQVDP